MDQMTGERRNFWDNRLRPYVVTHNTSVHAWARHAWMSGRTATYARSVLWHVFSTTYHCSQTHHDQQYEATPMSKTN